MAANEATEAQNACANCAILERAREKLRTNIQALKQKTIESSKLIKLYNAMEQDKKQMADDVKNLEAQLLASEIKLAGIQVELSKLQSTLAQTQQERDDYHKKYSQTEALAKELDAAKLSLRSEKALNEQLAEKSKAFVESEKLQKLNEKLTKQLASKDTDIKEYKARVDAAEARAKAAEDRFKASEDLIKAAEDRAKAAESCAKAAEDRAKAADELVKSVQERVRTAEYQARAAEERADAAQNRLITAQTELQAAQINASSSRSVSDQPTATLSSADASLIRKLEQRVLTLEKNKISLQNLVTELRTSLDEKNGVFDDPDIGLFTPSLSPSPSPSLISPPKRQKRSRNSDILPVAEPEVSSNDNLAKRSRKQQASTVASDTTMMVMMDAMPVIDHDDHHAQQEEEVQEESGRVSQRVLPLTMPRCYSNAFLTDDLPHHSPLPEVYITDALIDNAETHFVVLKAFVEDTNQTSEKIQKAMSYLLQLEFSATWDKFVQRLWSCTNNQQRSNLSPDDQLAHLQVVLETSSLEPWQVLMKSEALSQSELRMAAILTKLTSKTDMSTVINSTRDAIFVVPTPQNSSLLCVQLRVLLAILFVHNRIQQARVIVIDLIRSQKIALVWLDYLASFATVWPDVLMDHSLPQSAVSSQEANVVPLDRVILFSIECIAASMCQLATETDAVRFRQSYQLLVTKCQWPSLPLEMLSCRQICIAFVNRIDEVQLVDRSLVVEWTANSYNLLLAIEIICLYVDNFNWIFDEIMTKLLPKLNDPKEAVVAATLHIAGLTAQLYRSDTTGERQENPESFSYLVKSLERYLPSRQETDDASKNQLSCQASAARSLLRVVHKTPSASVTLSKWLQGLGEEALQRLPPNLVSLLKG